jgi:hypothetical protein
MMAAGLWLTLSSAGRPADYVDLELLLAVDVSASVDSSEYSLQMSGIAEAFRHPAVIAAIRASAPHGIAVALLQWAGPHEQTYSVPWSIVNDGVSAETFAQRVDAATRPLTSGGTAIGDALIVGVSLLAENGLVAARRVIDVSGDGRANQGTSPEPVRAHAASLGVTVNGLAIVNEEPQLIVYYAERVIGGSGAFVMHADDYRDFGRAIRLKLIREIAGPNVADAAPRDRTGAMLSAAGAGYPR